jgi:hypothetical protein
VRWSKEGTVLIATRQACHDVQVSLADGFEPQMKNRGKWGQKLTGTVRMAAESVRMAVGTVQRAARTVRMAIPG